MQEHMIKRVVGTYCREMYIALWGRRTINSGEQGEGRLAFRLVLCETLFGEDKLEREVPTYWYMVNTAAQGVGFLS